MKNKYFEIVGFYPCDEKKPKTKKFVGTLHVYDIEFKLDIRGCPCFKRPASFYVSPPMKKDWDPDEQKVVVYPIICYEPEKQNIFLNFLRNECSQYVAEKTEKKQGTNRNSPKWK
jgi:hypothetical protein